MSKKAFLLFLVLSAIFAIYLFIFMFKVKAYGATPAICDADTNGDEVVLDADAVDPSNTNDLCISPTPTETPSPTSSSSATLAPPPPTSGETHGGGTPNASQPICNIAFDAPKLQGFKRISPTSVEFSWWRSTDDGVTSQSIVYGFEQGKPLFGVNNLPKDQTSITLNDLPANKMIWGQVLSFKGQCAEKSLWLDP